jgi:hypothetical protein
VSAWKSFYKRSSAQKRFKAKDFDLGHILIFIVPCAFHTALYTHFIRLSNLMQAAGATTLRRSLAPPDFTLSLEGVVGELSALIRGVEKIAYASVKRRISHSLSREDDFKNSHHPLGDSGGYTFGINDAAHTKAPCGTTGFGFFCWLAAVFSHL